MYIYRKRTVCHWHDCPQLLPIQTFPKGITFLIHSFLIYATFLGTQLGNKQGLHVSELGIKSPSRNSELTKLTFPSVSSSPHVSLLFGVTQSWYFWWPTVLNSVGRVAQLVLRLTTGWTVRGSNPGGASSSARPDRPWGPPSLLYNGYRVFSGGKVRPGRAADHSPRSSAAVMEE